jgi:enamine deaminase RidA (YjgF/YER057c/UK114 family)
MRGADHGRMRGADHERMTRGPGDTQVTGGRQRISSGGAWEERIGYSHAVRVGDRVWVSGTTGTRAGGQHPRHDRGTGAPHLFSC